MNKKIILIVLVILAVAIIYFAYPRAENTFPPELKNAIHSEFQKLNITVSDTYTLYEKDLPLNITTASIEELGPQWGLVKLECEEGGYDLNPYAGKHTRIISYNVTNKAYRLDENTTLPVRAHVIAVENNIACIYGTVEELFPGVISISDLGGRETVP